MGWIKCLKIKYDKKGAETTLNKLLNSGRKHRQRNKQRHEQRIYHCPLCNAYHLTSKDYDSYDDLPDFVNKEEFYEKLKQTIEVDGD